MLDTVTTTRILYCRIAECEDWVGNTFVCSRFFSGNIVGGEMEVIRHSGLFQGDLIFFLPITHKPPPFEPLIGQGILSIVHGTMAGGRIVLGNVRMTKKQLKELSDAHVSGRI